MMHYWWVAGPQKESRPLDFLQEFQFRSEPYIQKYISFSPPNLKLAIRDVLWPFVDIRTVRLCITQDSRAIVCRKFSQKIVIFLFEEALEFLISLNKFIIVIKYSEGVRTVSERKNEKTKKS